MMHVLLCTLEDAGGWVRQEGRLFAQLPRPTKSAQQAETLVKYVRTCSHPIHQSQRGNVCVCEAASGTWGVQPGATKFASGTTFVNSYIFYSLTVQVVKNSLF